MYGIFFIKTIAGEIFYHGIIAVIDSKREIMNKTKVKLVKNILIND